MKKIIITFVLVMTSSLYAQDFHLRCSTPTTVVNLRVEGDFLVGQIRHPYGIKFTPFFKGQLSQFQVSQINSMSNAHSLLSNYQETLWPLENCKFRDSYLVSCRNGKFTIPDDSSMVPYVIETSLNQLELADASYDILNFRLGFRINGEDHSLTSDYSPELHCR